MNISWSRADKRWYLGVKCNKCGLPILFAAEPSEGADLAPLGKLVLTCASTDCRHKADYTGARRSRFQKVAG